LKEFRQRLDPINQISASHAFFHHLITAGTIIAGRSFSGFQKFRVPPSKQVMTDFRERAKKVN
jgi:hypothetical protein